MTINCPTRNPQKLSTHTRTTRNHTHTHERTQPTQCRTQPREYNNLYNLNNLINLYDFYNLYNLTKSELSLTLYENYNTVPEILDPYRIKLDDGCEFVTYKNHKTFQIECEKVKENNLTICSK